MKKIILLMIVWVIVATGFILPTYAIDQGYNYVNDEIGILNDDEQSLLNNLYQEISNQYNMDIALVIISDTHQQSLQNFADDYYDNHGFGRGKSRSGILLVHAIDARQWYITTTGQAIQIFTDAGLDYIGEKLKVHFKANEYQEAYQLFGSLSDDFIRQGINGKPFDVENLPRKALSPIYLVIGVGGALIIALVLVYNLKSKMITVTGKTEADDYVNLASVSLIRSKDQYLYSKVTRSLRPTNNQMSGSSTHTSSSGTSHGGRGGSY